MMILDFLITKITQILRNNTLIQVNESLVGGIVCVKFLSIVELYVIF